MALDPMIEFPPLHPVAFSLGPIIVRWYGLAYFFGVLGAWRYACFLLRRVPLDFTKQDLAEFVPWSIVGIVLGGRFGHVFFYAPYYFLCHPLEILQTWKGGMAFHGGFAGFSLMLLVFCWRRQIPWMPFSDVLAASAPIGLFLGRLANFVNQEIYGTVTSVPWAIAFPAGGFLPRHPVQLYEAFLEGILLFWILNRAIFRFHSLTRPGETMGLFMLSYGCMRFGIEYFREPEALLGRFFPGSLTAGQILSLPLMVVGSALISYAYYHHNRP